MPLELPAFVLDRSQTAPKLEPVLVDEPGAGEVRIQMFASGVCHTDVSAVRDARFYPIVLGHEGAGIVESVGPDVDTVRVGDHVVISWKVPCGRCRRCVAGRQDLCESVKGTREPRVHRFDGSALHVMLNAGTFCPYAVVPADAAVPVRRDMPLDRAALIGCAVATGVGAVLRTAAVQAGESVAIFGAGGIGLNVVQGARLARAGMIVAVDRLQSKLELAHALGATHTLNAGHADPGQAILELTDGRGVDHAFEAVGVPQVMEQALVVLAPGGVLTLIGASARDAEFSFKPRAFMSRQQTIRGCIYGSSRPAVDFPSIVEWYLSGLLHLDELLSDVIELEQLPAQFPPNHAPAGIRTIVRFKV
ncbi:MAG: zinc-binding dehydrogenase [Chloroflexi bacterium]|nr:zinc-binding dehydrogenase [Chloroflexota bacterium]